MRRGESFTVLLGDIPTDACRLTLHSQPFNVVSRARAAEDVVTIRIRAGELDYTGKQIVGCEPEREVRHLPMEQDARAIVRVRCFHDLNLRV